MTPWQEFPWLLAETDRLDDRLRERSLRGAPLVGRIEGDDLTTRAADVTERVVIWAYNVERGLRLDDQLRAFATKADPAPDILLLSEADHGCSRSGDRHVAREYARALGMYYVFGVEFVELPRFWGPGGGRVRTCCEHGNAIVSRYPLGNVRLIRHQRVRNWNSRLQRQLGVGEPRRGGRVALRADVRIGERLLRVYTVHLESGRRNFGHGHPADIRTAQATEVMADAGDVHHGVIVGGDMNVAAYLTDRAHKGYGDPTAAAFFDGGFHDAHESLGWAQRVTSDSGATIDLIVGRDVRFTDAGVGARSTWGGLSDHLPVWASVTV